MRLLLIAICLALVALPVIADKKPSREVVVTDRQAGTLEVKPPRPEVWYLLPRSALDFTRRLLEKKLSQKIGAATQKEPF